MLRKRLGPLWRFWVWFAGQWSATSLSVLGGVIVFIGGYGIQMRERVVVLETKVIPFVQGESKLEALGEKVQEHTDRIERLEREWDSASKEALTSPRGRRDR